jgi:hypothetical protein
VPEPLAPSSHLSAHAAESTHPTSGAPGAGAALSLQPQQQQQVQAQAHRRRAQQQRASARAALAATHLNPDQRKVMDHVLRMQDYVLVLGMPGAYCHWSKVTTGPPCWCWECQMRTVIGPK